MVVNAKLAISYMDGEGYSIEYEPEQNHLATLKNNITGIAGAVLWAKEWLKENHIKNAEIWEPHGAIWEIKGHAIKRIEPSNWK